MTDKNITNIRDFKKYILRMRKDCIKKRESTRGTGVFLAENIDSYYMNIGEFLCMEEICKVLGLDVEHYSPWETEDDDSKFNYCGGLSKIGVINDR